MHGESEGEAYLVNVAASQVFLMYFFCVGDVIVGCDNNSIQSFEWHYVVPYYSSLVSIRVEALRLCLQILEMLNYLVHFSCFTILLSCLLVKMYLRQFLHC